MKQILYLIIFLSILSCNNNEQLNGTWVSTSNGPSDSTEFKMIGIPPQQIFTFFDGKYEFGEYLNGEEIFGNGTYKITADSIQYDKSFSLLIDIHPEEFMTSNEGNTSFRFRKINDSLKFRSSTDYKLDDKTFEVLFNEKIMDTISFLNDSVVRWKSDRNKTGANKYSFFNHNGFQMLSIRWMGQSVIYRIDEGIIFMKLYEKEVHDFRFKEIN